MAPRWPQDGPKMAQDSPKMAPRGPQDGPRRPQDGAKMEDDSKMEARCPNMAKICTPPTQNHHFSGNLSEHGNGKRADNKELQTLRPMSNIAEHIPRWVKD